MRSCSAKIASAIAALGLFSSSQIVHAVAIPIATWGGTSSSNWSDAGNWTTGSVPPASLPPGPTDVADFVNAGNGNTNINLGGSQSAGAVQFDTAGAVSYTIGGTSDTLTLANVSAINVTGTVANAQAINASLSLGNAAPSISNAAAVGLTLGPSSLPGIITLASGSTLSLVPTNASAVITINDSIQGSGSVTLAGSTSGTVVFNGASTYSGLTSQASTSANTVQIGSSTDTANNATFASGPFGKSTLTFNDSGNTSAPLQAVNADQTIANAINFNNGGWTITDAATPHNLAFTGPITFVQSRTLNMNAFGQTITLGSASNPSTLTLTTNTSSADNIDVDASATGASPTTTIINDVIQNGGAGTVPPVTYNSAGNNTPMGILQLNGASTYTSQTNVGSQSSGSVVQGLTVQLGVSSAGSPGSLTSGPFGKGILNWAGASSSPGTIQPFGGDRTVGNAVTLGSGFFVAEPTAAQDPTITSAGPHSLILSGVIGSDAKVITNNLPSGAALVLGASGNPQTLLLAAATFQTQPAASGAGGGITVFNDQLTGTSMTVKGGGSYYINNTNNTYTGNTTVSGAGTGAAGLGTGATLAGTGNVGVLASGTGIVTVGSTTAGSVGGIVSPGGDGITNLTGVGTLFAPNVTLDPFGRYVFQFSPTNAAIGGGVNDLINIAGALNVSNLSGGQFDLNLAPLAAGTPQAQYTLATFASITGATAGQDVTSDISFSGTIPSAPHTVTVSSDGKSLLLNFAVPEPGSLSLLSLGALGLIRRRRRAM